MRKVKINLSDNTVSMPEYKTDGSSGLDISAHIEDNIELLPLERVMVPTGIRLDMDRGMEAQIRPRSGLAAKHGVSVLNTPGTIDSDYRGEIKIILVNLSNKSFTIEPGMRIAQMVFSMVEQVELDVSMEISETARGEGGFGHTGYYG